MTTRRIFKILVINLLITVGLLLPNLIEAQYYERVIGARAGSTAGLSYKQVFAKRQAIEGIVGLRLGRGVTLSALYEYHFDIGFDSGFDWYVGGGLTSGWFFDQSPSRFGAGVMAVAGIEYTFRPWPINISIDYMPILGYRSTALSGAASLRYGF
jgi:hypothetical protein